MSDPLFTVQAAADSDFVPLARTSSGRLFRKQILTMDSDFAHPSVPGAKIHVDKAFAESLRQNFSNNVCPIVQVPVVNDLNAHVEDPLRNMGEVVDLTYDDKGVYAVIDARKNADDVGKTLLGASALLSTNYTNTLTGEKVGPTLLHVAMTNRPYLTNLSEFEEMAALSAADTSGESPVALIPADDFEEEETMELDQMLEALKTQHGIDVAALQANSGGSDSAELVAALSNVLGSATGKTDVLTVKDVADAVIELAEGNVALSSQVETLNSVNEAMQQKAAETEIDGYVRAGRVLPKQRDTMVALSLTNRDAFDALLPDDAIVALSEQGVQVFDEPASEKLAADIERLANVANGVKK